MLLPQNLRLLLSKSQSRNTILVSQYLQNLDFQTDFFFPTSKDPISGGLLPFLCSLNIKVKWKRDLANVLRTNLTVKSKNRFPICHMLL